jgi:hypothetical protein
MLIVLGGGEGGIRLAFFVELDVGGVCWAFMVNRT